MNKCEKIENSCAEEFQIIYIETLFSEMKNDFLFLKRKLHKAISFQKVQYGKQTNKQKQCFTMEKLSLSQVIMINNSDKSC